MAVSVIKLLVTVAVRSLQPTLGGGWPVAC